MTSLKRYFPVIREREEVLNQIYQNKSLKMIFESWEERQQNIFLDICTGMRGVKILYDIFFKTIFDPLKYPDRLDQLLSLLLEKNVKILQILPLESPRIADESSLLIMDIVVQLEDGGIANVEVQKIGYKFPGTRSACYSADLLLRQYKRVREKKGKSFQYRDIKPVYTIVFFEDSPVSFKKFPDVWMHYFEQKSNTGLELDLLQKYLFIGLDIFRKNQQNKPIRNKTDAWLTFLSRDEPEKIIELIEQYPEFKPMYEDIYAICRNIEEVMGMFSKELQILDKNTVQLMIDEMQEEIETQRQSLQEKDERIEFMQKRDDLIELLVRDKREALIGSVMRDESICLRLLKEYKL